MRDSACGYFLEDAMLVRKWVQCSGFVGDPVLQIVLPAKLWQLVLQVAHDESGHFRAGEDLWLAIKAFFLATYEEGRVCIH